MTRTTNEHAISSGNVFADLCLPESDALLAKAALTDRIARIISERRLTQAQAARLLGTAQPKVSDLLAGRLSGFSMERLIRFLVALDCDVDIVVSPSASKDGAGVVRVTDEVRPARPAAPVASASTSTPRAAR